MWPTDLWTFLAGCMGLADSEVGGTSRALGVRHQLCHCDIGGMDEDVKTETFASLESWFDKGRLMVIASSDASPVPCDPNSRRHQISWEILLGPRTPDWNITMFWKYSGSTPGPGAWMQYRCWLSRASWYSTPHEGKSRRSSRSIPPSPAARDLNTDDSRLEDPPVSTCLRCRQALPLANVKTYSASEHCSGRSISEGRLPMHVW
jgi:hypothetical protein